MKHSIRRQFALIFIGLVAGTIVLSLCIHHIFLESFYMKRKTTVILDAYESIGQMTGEDIYSTDNFYHKLEEICRVNNITVFIMDANSQTRFVSSNGGRELEARLMGYMFGLPTDSRRVELLKTGGDYVLHRTRVREGEFIEMYGRLSSGISFIMTSPIESIRESASVANTFYAYVGAIAAVVGGIIIWLVASRITKPILELNRISRQMVKLYFDTKYQGQVKNEIGLLGRNMNELSETLEQAITELKSANNELQKDIQEKEQIDEMRREFLSNVSHELKTPIALIQGYAEGLREGVSTDPEGMQYYCDVIVDEANKMNSMVQKLLTLNHLENSSEPIHMTRVDIAEVVKNCAKSFDILMKQKEIILQMQDTPSLFVWADEYGIEEVITNYLSNAVNHCEGEKKIVLSFTEQKDKIRVNIFNTGTPIPEEALEHIWEKFYKVDKARTREYGGSGIGLSVVKAIMDSMHQKYGVENYNNGVLFWFELEKCEKV